MPNSASGLVYCSPETLLFPTLSAVWMGRYHYSILIDATYIDSLYLGLSPWGLDPVFGLLLLYFGPDHGLFGPSFLLVMMNLCTCSSSTKIDMTDWLLLGQADLLLFFAELCF